MQKLLALLVLGVTAAAGLVASGPNRVVAATSGPALDVLFVGNSLIGTNTRATGEDTPAVLRRLAAAGRITRSGGAVTVTLPADPGPDLVPDLVADLVGLGARVHAVEPARISLEERLLGILRAGEGGDR
jgi:hypothetical protein